MAKGAAPKVVAKAAVAKKAAPKAKAVAKPVKKVVAKKAAPKKVVAKKGAKVAKKVTKKGSKWITMLQHSNACWPGITKEKNKQRELALTIGTPQTDNSI